MVKTVKVRALNSSGTSGTTVNQPLADKEDTDIQTRCCLKLLTGFFIGQMIMITVIASTLGVLVNANTKEIDELKQRTGSLQGDMERVQTNIGQQTSDGSDVETRLLNLESTQAKHDIELQDLTLSVVKSVLLNMSAVLDGVNMAPTSRFVTFQDLNDTISDIEANFESENEINKELITNIAQLEMDMTSHIATFQNNTNRITQLESKIAELETNLKSESTTLKSQGEIILALNNTVMQLETIINQSQSEIINELELKITSLKDAVQNQSWTTDQLRANMQGHNASLYNYISRLDELDSNQNSDGTSIANHSIRITDIEFSLQSYSSIIQVQNTTIQDLELEANLTEHTLQDYSTRLQDLELDANLTEHTLQDYSTRLHDLELEENITEHTLQNYSTRLHDIQLKANLTEHTLQDYSTRLQDLELEANHTEHTLQDYSTRLQKLELETNLTLHNLQDYNTRLTDLTDALNCTWGNWDSFSTCSHSCGGGTKYRTRRCQSINPLSQDWFPRTETDIQPCNTQTCPDIKSAFSVRNPTGGPKSGTITFTHLITDIGGHYDRATGKFTCQYPGIYVFSLNIVKADGEATAVCYIRKNDNNMASVAANPFISSGWFGSSNTVVFHLLSGDVVHLESCTPAITMSSGYTTTFSGFLLQAD